MKDFLTVVLGIAFLYFLWKIRMPIFVVVIVILVFLLIVGILMLLSVIMPKEKPSIDLSQIDGMDGHDFEHWCAELLRRNGFTNVSVTPGSNDQGIDVLAYKDGLKYGVQCKCYASDLGYKPVQEATAGRAVYGCDIAVVMTNRHFTKGAVDAARATGVWLWDRDKLAQMVQAAKQESNT